MADFLHSLVSHSEPLTRLRKSVEELSAAKPLIVTGLTGSLMAVAADHCTRELGGQILILTSEKDRAERLRDDCSSAGVTPTAQFVHAQHHTSTLLDMTGPVMNTETLRALLRDEPLLIAASIEAVASRVPKPEVLQKQIVTVEVGKDVPFQNLIETLTGLGFERKDFVEGYGDIAVRGGIIDVFPFIGEHPLRIELWGDSVESIREFDARSQRSIRPLSIATIAANMYGVDSDESSRGTIFDYLTDKAIILLDEPAGLQHELEELHKEGIDQILTWEELLERTEQHRRIIHSMFLKKETHIDFQGIPQPPFNGSIKFLLEELQRRKAAGFSIILASDTSEEQERLRELIDEESERTQAQDLSIQHVAEAIHEGFVYPPASLVVFTEHEIFGRLKRRGIARRTAFKGMSQRELIRLKRGDFVVHSDYGIGRFAGLQTINVGEAEQEVMKVLYEENDALYVNLNFINRVQKYSSRDGHEPLLTRLGTPQWDRLKAKARKRIKDIARDLIALYAKRKHETGFSFSPDSHWQKELEASFMYEDTVDQAKATADVKTDMIQPFPMDRLICGDVGFGKTEVAVRAAFKTVLDGKQVAVLVPTTILAQQHRQTFMDRLQRYTVRVESLTRFKSKKEQNAVLEELRQGTIDILIGTHRLLSKDVQFKDLGLLVVDEEHRFGVTAKEKLRQLKASVDTLTLTATPIPRTLQFSLMGARDLSIINTPPRNRLPIITEIAEFNAKLVREAILREIHRGGQVYFIHDRIQNMEDILQVILKVVPEVRVHTAHGQMKGHELEQTMVHFLERKYDVLVCTKIIESGIDIPSVNTIIINRADRFGLAELYQLRGRVGRSNVQAYAYLFTPPLMSLPRGTLQRLQAIQEFTELGSGFNLAMRDMEIRGAGNLLGAEQSGFILEMGFEMYQKIVEEAVQELKHDEFHDLTSSGPSAFGSSVETVIESDVEAMIPDVYIASDSERLDVYRRLYQVRDLPGVSDIRAELQDRFGEYPPEVEYLFKIVEIKLAASQRRFSKVQISGRLLTLWFPPESDSSFYDDRDGASSLFQTIMDTVLPMKEHRAQLRQDGKQLKLHLSVPDAAGSGERLKLVMNFLARLPAGEAVA
ncbi:MAG: transcription-repair coupling factor [Bacteroidota bacterium]